MAPHEHDHWSDRQEAILAGIASVSSSLSLIAGICVTISVLILTWYHRTTRKSRYLHLRVEKEMGIQQMYAYTRMSSKKSQFRRLVFGLIVADCMFATVKLIACLRLLFWKDIAIGSFCSITGILQDTAALTTGIYVVEISIAMNSFAAQWTPKVPTMAKYALEAMGHLLAWTLPFIPAIIPLFPGVPSKYNPGGAWCFISTDPWWSRTLLFYLWIWIAFGLILVMYIVLIFLLARYLLTAARHLRRATRRKAKSVILQFSLLPLVFLMLWLPATMNRILGNAGIHHYWLAGLEAASLPLQGLLDCLLYGYMTVYMDVRNMMKMSFRRQLQEAGGSHLLTESITSDDEEDYSSATLSPSSQRL